MSFVNNSLAGILTLAVGCASAPDTSDTITLYTTARDHPAWSAASQKYATEHSENGLCFYDTNFLGQRATSTAGLPDPVLELLCDSNGDGAVDRIDVAYWQHRRFITDNLPCKNGIYERKADPAHPECVLNEDAWSRAQINFDNKLLDDYLTRTSH